MTRHMKDKSVVEAREAEAKYRVPVYASKAEVARLTEKVLKRYANVFKELAKR